MIHTHFQAATESRSLLRWLDMTRIYIQKVHLTACTDRSGDQTHWLNLQSITQLLGHVRTFRHQLKETKLKCCERKHVNRNILYLVTVCSLETTNQFKHFFFFLIVHSEVLWSTVFYVPYYVFVYTRVYSVVYGLEHNMSTLFLWSMEVIILR